MTNLEFQTHLSSLFAQNPLMRHTPHTLNELVFLLRREPDEYSLSWNNRDGGWSCVPSAKECFIPVRDLAKHIKSVEYSEETYDDEVYRNLEVVFE